jgi:hypothetical protein
MLVINITESASYTVRCEYSSRKLRELRKSHLFLYFIFVCFPSGSLVLEEEGMYHMNERRKERQKTKTTGSLVTVW